MILWVVSGVLKMVKEEINEMMGTRSYDMEMEYNINFYTILLSHTITPYLIPTGSFYFVYFFLFFFFSFVRVCYVMETDGSALKQCDKFLFIFFQHPEQNNNENKNIYI